MSNSQFYIFEHVWHMYIFIINATDTLKDYDNIFNIFST